MVAAALRDPSWNMCMQNRGVDLIASGQDGAKMLKLADLLELHVYCTNTLPRWWEISQMPMSHRTIGALVWFSGRCVFACLG